MERIGCATTIACMVLAFSMPTEVEALQADQLSDLELHRYVRESVGRFSAGAQTPTMLGDAGRWVVR